MSSLSVDLLECAQVPVYHIDYEAMEVIEETLIPVCTTDYYWYSNKKDVYFLESDVYVNLNEALEVLLGFIIKAKKDVLLTLSAKEKMIVDILSGTEYNDEGLVG